MNNQHNPIIKRLINDLLAQHSDNIIAIYGIGSYFDDSLPPNWVKNDLDIIIIVKSLSKVPKQDWTDVRYQRITINGYQVWFGFNTIEAYQDRYRFNKESFSNYEWSLIDIKHPENSKLLYGKDIRDQLPETQELIFDYDDVLARGLYHLDKSFSEKDLAPAMKECSKGVFKTAFYFCTFLNKAHRNTSIIEIGNKLKQLSEGNKFLEDMIGSLEEVVIYKITGQFKANFEDFRKNFITHLFSLLEKGILHREMNYEELLKYLTDKFSGFLYLIQMVNTLDIFKENKITIANLTHGMRNITIIGIIKEIFGTFRFDKEAGTEGKVGSFTIYDSTGKIRVVLWDEQVRFFRSNDFNVGRSLLILNGYTKQGRKGGIEVHVSTFGKVIILPKDKKAKKLKKITKRELAKRLDFIKDSKSIRIPCPHCGFLCPPQLEFCGKCGELLHK